MTETAKQTAKATKATKVATTPAPAPNPELQAKYQDLYGRQRAHATTHDGCNDKCPEAKKFRLEMKALDGEAKKLYAATATNGVPAAKPLGTAAKEAAQALVDEAAAAVAAVVKPKAKSKPKAKVAKAVTPVAEAPKAEKVAKAPKAPPAPADFLMYVGGAFYTKEQFIQEAQEMGVSKRLPTFRIPPDMVVGKSRIWLAEGGERKASEKGKLDAPEAHSHIFGYFIPDAIEFIAGEDGDKTYADVIGYLKTVEGAKIVQGNPEVIYKKRFCGVRKVGGTYLVTKEASGKKSPIILLDKELPYIGNHFRGLMRLDEKATAKLDAGEGLTTLIQDQCMRCEAEMLVAPDSRKRAAVERRRIERGEEPKWVLECAECRNLRREEDRKAKEAKMAAGDGTDEQGTPVDAPEEAQPAVEETETAAETAAE